MCAEIIGTLALRLISQTGKWVLDLFLLVALKSSGA